MILLLLTLVTLGAGARNSLAVVSYVKAIDIWMFLCLFHVCATLGIVGTSKKVTDQLHQLHLIFKKYLIYKVFKMFLF